MVWQNMSPFPTPRMDAEEEREMRLAAQARAGAEWALAALIARYQPPVLRYLARLTGDPFQSHRIAERIFVRMERRLRGPHGSEHLRLWLLRAATEAGLDALRHPRRTRQQSRLNAPAGPRGLLADGSTVGATDRLRAGLSRIVAITGSTRRQVRQLIWNADDPAAESDGVAASASPQASVTSADEVQTPPVVDPELDTMNPQEELRHRLVRAVLAELPYGDAQCLALHLVAGLNQAEVARALGIRPSAARHRIVQGLQMFAHRYDAAITSLGVPTEVAYAETPESLPAGMMNMVDVAQASQTVQAAQASLPPQTLSDGYYPAPVASSIPADTSDTVIDVARGESPAFDEVFPEVYDENYDTSDVVSAPVVSAPTPETASSVSAPPPVIVDALPVTDAGGQYDAHGVYDVYDAYDASEEAAGIADEVSGGELEEDWLDQPTMVPVLSTAPSLDAPPAPPESLPLHSGMPHARATMEITGAEADESLVAETPSSVPILTPPNYP